MKSITQSQVGIIGSSLQGLLLARSFLYHKIPVIIYEPNQNKMSSLKQYTDSILDSTDDILSKAFTTMLRITDSICEMQGVKNIIVVDFCRNHAANSENQSALISIVQEVAAQLRVGQLLVFYGIAIPGTMDNIILPIIKNNASSCITNERVAYAYSIDLEMCAEFSTTPIGFIVGSNNRQSRSRVARLFVQLSSPVASLFTYRAAEARVIYEVAKWTVISSFNHEMHGIMQSVGYSITDLFLPPMPSSQANNQFLQKSIVNQYQDMMFQFFQGGYRQSRVSNIVYNAACEVSNDLSYYHLRRIDDAFNSMTKPLRNSKICVIFTHLTIFGMDNANFKYSMLLRLLLSRGVVITYATFNIHHKLVKYHFHDNKLFSEIAKADFIGSQDCVLLLESNSDYDIKYLAKKSSLIIDACNATRFINANNGNVVYI